MLDWYSGIVGYDASALAVGRVLRLCPDGSIEWERPAWETVEGSYSAGVQVTRSSPTSGMLQQSIENDLHCHPVCYRISGNPTKFLQGHNLGGPSVSMLTTVLWDLFNHFPVEVSDRDYSFDEVPSTSHNRIDITTHVDLGNHDQVHRWLRLAEHSSRSRHGRAIASSGTVYWGKNSRRWTIKAYCKHCELKKHPPESPELLALLLDASASLLRIELTLRSLELKNIEAGRLNENLIWEYFKRIEVHQMTETKLHEGISELRGVHQLLLTNWYRGEDVALLFNRMTFYRYRKAIIEATGIDVSIPRDEQSDNATDALIDLDEMMKREVKEFPQDVQRTLWGHR